MILYIFFLNKTFYILSQTTNLTHLNDNEMNSKLWNLDWFFLCYFYYFLPHAWEKWFIGETCYCIRTFTANTVKLLII